jgi:hypothetical protein
MAAKWRYMKEPLPDWVKGSMRERFTRICEKRFWEVSESSSGPGSTLEQTGKLILELPLLLHSLEIKTPLDLPCGDFNWMNKVDLQGILYFGAEIVPELVEQNRQAFGSPDRQFLELDMTRDPLPTVDLILCRDGLVHLSFDAITKALANFRQSGASYLLATTFPSHQENRDIETGDWRPLNLEADPLLLGKPELLLNENCPEEGFEDKSLGLWSLSD